MSKQSEAHSECVCVWSQHPKSTESTSQIRFLFWEKGHSIRVLFSSNAHSSTPRRPKIPYLCKILSSHCARQLGDFPFIRQGGSWSFSLLHSLKPEAVSLLIIQVFYQHFHECAGVIHQPLSSANQLWFITTGDEFTQGFVGPTLHFYMVLMTFFWMESDWRIHICKAFNSSTNKHGDVIFPQDTWPVYFHWTVLLRPWPRTSLWWVSVSRS